MVVESSPSFGRKGVFVAMFGMRFQQNRSGCHLRTFLSGIGAVTGGTLTGFPLAGHLFDLVCVSIDSIGLYPRRIGTVLVRGSFWADLQ